MGFFNFEKKYVSRQRSTKGMHAMLFLNYNISIYDDMNYFCFPIAIITGGFFFYPNTESMVIFDRSAGLGISKSNSHNNSVRVGLPRPRPFPTDIGP